MITLIYRQLNERLWYPNTNALEIPESYIKPLIKYNSSYSPTRLPLDIQFCIVIPQSHFSAMLTIDGMSSTFSEPCPGLAVAPFSWHRTAFRINGHLCGEFTGHGWIPITKGPVKRTLFCFVRLSELLNKMSNCRWFETPGCSCSGTVLAI